MKKIFIGVTVLASVAAFSQTGKVGVNSNAPTEILDVNGTAKVRDLPANGASNAIYSTGATTTGPVKTGTFTATRTVVADVNGVLGTVAGLPTANAITAVNGTAPITAATTNGTTTVSIARNDLSAAASANNASSAVSITNGTGAVLNNTTIAVNNTAPLWNANQLQGTSVAATAPTAGQVLSYNGTSWAPANATGPWNLQQTTTAATSNTQNIYQAGRVGVGHTVSNLPTETFDVNGTARIRQLPTSGTTGIYTTGTESTSTVNNQTFTATRTVVADANGVLGSVPRRATLYNITSIPQKIVADNNTSPTSTSTATAVTLATTSITLTNDAFVTISASVPITTISKYGNGTPDANAGLADGMPRVIRNSIVINGTRYASQTQTYTSSASNPVNGILYNNVSITIPLTASATAYTITLQGSIFYNASCYMGDVGTVGGSLFTVTAQY